jgi:hypothetical protein
MTPTTPAAADRECAEKFDADTRTMMNTAELAALAQAFADRAEAVRAECLLSIATDDALLEVGRKAIEDTLIEFRDSRLSQIRNNGLVCREKDGTESCIIRLGPEDALRIGLKAIAAQLTTTTEARDQ